MTPLSRWGRGAAGGGANSSYDLFFGDPLLRLGSGSVYRDRSECERPSGGRSLYLFSRLALEPAPAHEPRGGPCAHERRAPAWAGADSRASPNGGLSCIHVSCFLASSSACSPPRASPVAATTMTTTVA